MLCLTVLWMLSTCTASFEVTTSPGHLVAVRGSPIVLGCRFTPDPSSVQEGLVVTWQRVEDSKVVHSFYYSQNQLERQSPEYHNRTDLYPSEFLGGNASLRIQQVGPKDAGRYLCSVSNLKGSDKAQVQLEYAAFYTEPRLSVHVNPDNITVLFESEGYPEPEVRWEDPAGQELVHHTGVSPRADDDGLLSIRTEFVTLDLNKHLNLTVTLRNRLLKQILLRPIIFSPGECRHTKGGVVTALAVLCVFLTLCVGFIFWFYRRRECRMNENVLQMKPSNVGLLDSNVLPVTDA